MSTTPMNGAMLQMPTDWSTEGMPAAVVGGVGVGGGGAYAAGDVAFAEVREK